MLLPGRDVDEARRFAEAIQHALELPTTLQGHVVDVRGSIGIAVFPEHGAESSTLLRRADIAMYAAKRGNSGAAVWDQDEDKLSSERLSLLSDLRKAVDNDELTLAYQPKVMLRGSGGELYTEALVRWRHPTRGLVAPIEFIPFAEQTGYIRAITQWVLAHAIAQCAEWRFNGLPMNVSINLSARDLMDATLPDRVAALLQRHRCAAQWISLEITESAILDDPAHAIKNLERLHALGCRLAIDDYGTGYSSLAYLRRLPVHEIKIDKSFVIGMATDDSDELIVRSTIDLAHGMGLSVVAEGVEDDATSTACEPWGATSCRATCSAAPWALPRRLCGCEARYGPGWRANRRPCAASSDGAECATRARHQDARMSVSSRYFSRPISRTRPGTWSRTRACRRRQSRLFP